VRHDTWTALAGALFFLLALPFGAIAAFLIGDVLARGHEPGRSGGLFEVMVGLAGLLSLIAVGHIAAAVQTWRQRGRSDSLGRMVGLVGFGLGSAVFGITLFSARDVAAWALLIPASYLVVLLALRAARPHGASRTGR
jgi:hypothetical protein